MVTGGSRGIGAAIAIRLASSGFDIWLNYRSDHDTASRVRDEIVSMGRECVLLPFDVSDFDAAEQALQPLLDETVPFGIVHNAGFARDGLAAMMSKKDWDAVIGVHLDGFFNIVHPVLKLMMRKRRGRIVAITSVSGQTGQAGQFNYSAAKAGVEGAVRALAREVAPRNILVNCVAPGLVETDMTSGLPVEEIIPLIPMRRPAQAEEIAGAVAFLLSRDSSYITGQVIGVNGGLYM